METYTGVRSRSGSSGVSKNTSSPANDVDQEAPTYIGSDRNYYKDEFIFPAVVAEAGRIRSYQSKIFPARYYGHPKYSQAFGRNGLGLIAIDQLLGKSSSKTPATFYQYKLDYFRKKAVVFVIADGLSQSKLGPSTVSLQRNDLVKLAKMGYLVVQLKPRFMKTRILDENKCAKLGKFFFNGV